MYPNKFQLSPAENLFLAKKKWDENVYCGMKMEQRNITFSQTKTILDGVNVPGVQLDDIQAVLNMRDAWRYLLQTVSEPVTLAYICKLNEFVARNEALSWGTLRTGAVGISGTDYIPPVPKEADVLSRLNALLTSNCTETEKALRAFAWCARTQLFWDGNKRTGLLLANKLLIMAGGGILTITDNHMERFNALLTAFYTSGDEAALLAFMYENAIWGMTIGE